MERAGREMKRKLVDQKQDQDHMSLQSYGTSI